MTNTHGVGKRRWVRGGRRPHSCRRAPDTLVEWIARKARAADGMTREVGLGRERGHVRL